MFEGGRLLARKYRCAESRSRSYDEHVAFPLNDPSHLGHVIYSGFMRTLSSEGDPFIGDVLRQPFS
ncbi:hypothetical protein GW16_18300 [Xanthomonas arboricola pv. celebensis]|nr:hypothetical protein GW16_18300 [Xanthomonas arboricola pv. celebensis]